MRKGSSADADVQVSKQRSGAKRTCRGNVWINDWLATYRHGDYVRYITLCFGYVCVMIEVCDQVSFEQSEHRTGVRRQVCMMVQER
jgi:hypothetical protein